MTKRWIPSDWLDEMVTGLSDSPNDFLRRTPEGVLQLHPAADEVVHDLDEDGVAEWRIRALEPEQVVEFSWTENYGEATLTVHSDGTWSCDREFPSTATHFWLPWDSGTMQPSLADLVKGSSDWGEIGPLEPGEHTVGAYAWSDPIKFAVRVLESGAAEFVEVGTA